MGLLNKDKVEVEKELSPQEKVGRVLQAIKDYTRDNEKELQDNPEKNKELTAIVTEAEMLERDDQVTDTQAMHLAQEARGAGVEVNLDAENDEAPKTKEANLRMATYLVAALAVLGVVGGVYYHQITGNDEEAKTEEQGGEKVKKEEGGVDASTAKYEDHMQQLEELGKINKQSQEDLKNVK